MRKKSIKPKLWDLLKTTAGLASLKMSMSWNPKEVDLFKVRETKVIELNLVQNPGLEEWKNKTIKDITGTNRAI